MKFRTQKPDKINSLALEYIEEDYSFSTLSHDGSGYSSVMINDLQLEIDEKGKIVYVWGLCPLINYKETSFSSEKYKIRSLVLILDSSPIPGISYRVNENDRWPIHINKEKGWICLGTSDLNSFEIVEFQNGCVAVLDNGELKAVWLKPTSLPNSEIREKCE